MKFFKRVLIYFLAFAFFANAIHAELFSSSLHGWTLDLPEGFAVVEAGQDGLSYYMEHDFMKVRLVIKLYPAAQYERNDIAMEEVLNKLNADGEIDGFLWRGRQSSIASYSFKIPGNDTAQSGWGISVTLPQSNHHMVVLCYSDSDIANDVQQFIVSSLDSIIIEQSDWRAPGIITSYAFPSEEKDDIVLDIGGKKVYTKILRDGAASGRFAIDREFSVLTLYANRKNWKEAWQRYYRIIFREAYSRLDLAARDIYNAIAPVELANKPEQIKFEMIKKLLAWTQDFNYARGQDKSDFNDLTSVLQNKGSDCDSRSLLLCILMEHYGVQTELFISHEYSHAICGFNLQGKGAHIKVDGVNYLLCETTAPVDVGLIAAEHSDTDKWISVDLP